MASFAASAASPRTGPGLYATFTVTAALVAACAVGAALTLALPPWAMFMGWVAYFTRTPSVAQGLWTFACAVAGLGLAATGTLAAGALAPMLGLLTLPVVVFVTALVVIAARGLPVMNNLLGYFLGLITFFAAHQPPAFATLGGLSLALALGLVAAWTALTLEAGVRRVIAR